MSYDKSNIFAKILAGSIPANVVYEDESVLAFHDISRAKAVHCLVIPKGAYISFADFCENASAEVIADFFVKVNNIATNILGLAESGFRLITNHGADANQSVGHFHIHILGGENVGALVAGDEGLR